MEKTCMNCTARIKDGCALKFKTEMVNGTQIPKENCPKPTTYAKYVELYFKQLK